MPLFDSDFLKKLEYLSLVSRRVFQGQILAQRRTLQTGGGIEFADHRDYVPGDDFRYLDWNVYARHDEMLLKRFQEEEDLHVYVLLDCSRSMNYGQPSKFDLARQVAAALAYIALANLDRAAVVGFADGIGEEFPLTRGKGRILALLKFLESLDVTDHATNLLRAAADFIHRRYRRGVVMLISDLYDPDGYQDAVDMLRHRQYEPHLIQLYDRREAEPTTLGDVELVDVETDEARKLTITESLLRQYRQRYDEFQQSIQGYARHYGLPFTRSTTDVAFDDLVMSMLRTSGTVA